MLSSHPEIKDFGNEDETNYEADEINRGSMKTFCIFIVDQKSENTKHTTKYDKQTWCRFCRKKSELREVKDVLFSIVKLSQKRKIAYRINLRLLRVFNKAFSGTSSQKVQR